MSETFLTELPQRAESLLKLVAHGLQSGDPPVHVGISSTEAPSAVLVSRRVFPELVVEAATTPDPDPRVPFEPVRISMWTYEGDQPAPALKPPRREVAAACASVAATTYSLDSWGRLCQRIATAFRSAQPCEVLGVMLYPDRRPPRFTPWDWLFRNQIVAAMVLSRARHADWWTSAPGSHLRDVVHGPVDWTTTAALVAMTDRARRDRVASKRFVDLALTLLGRPMSPIWFMCVYAPCWQLLQHVPDLDEGTRRVVRESVERIDAE